MTMGYEYEKFILSLLTSLAIKKENKGYYVIADEVEEVYIKAKILNKIIDIVKTGRSLEDFGDVEVTLLAIEHELNYILEDK